MRRSNLGREFNQIAPDLSETSSSRQRHAQADDSFMDDDFLKSFEPEDGPEQKTSQPKTSQSEAQRNTKDSNYQKHTQGEGAGRPPKNKKKKRIGIIITSVVLILILCAAMFAYYEYSLQPKSTSSSKKIIEISEGSSIGDIANELYDEGLIRSALVFQSYAGRQAYDGNTIKAAKYELSPDMSVEEIYSKLSSGDAYHGTEYIITVPEGKNLKEIAEIVEESGLATKDEFIQEASDLKKYMAEYDILSSIPSEDVSQRTLEGYLYPQTYHVYVDEGEDGSENLINQMLTEFTDNFTTKMIEQANKDGRTVDDIVIMASIVEMETKLPEDKANAASVFYNRIAQDMPLQSDITVDYALGTKTAVLTTEQVQSTDSPYNTYLYKGLPLGPIASPSQSSIEAALYPANTNYLYFVADMSTGKLYFNETYEGHEADVEKYMSDTSSVN